MDSDEKTPKDPDPGSHPRPEEQPPAPSEGSVTHISDEEAGSAADDETRTGRGLERLLATVEWLGNLLPHPVTLFALFALGVAVVSIGWKEGAAGRPREEATV